MLIRKKKDRKVREEEEMKEREKEGGGGRGEGEDGMRWPLISGSHLKTQRVNYHM